MSSSALTRTSAAVTNHLFCAQYKACGTKDRSSIEKHLIMSLRPGVETVRFHRPDQGKTKPVLKRAARHDGLLQDQTRRCVCLVKDILKAFAHSQMYQGSESSMVP